MGTIWEQLSEPFSDDEIEWRLGPTSDKDANNPKGLALPFIKSRAVMDRLDRVVGPQNWQTTLKGVANGFICELSIRIDGEWITKSDAAGLTDVEAIKGGASDSLKRAAVHFGIGRYLYYTDRLWVPIKKAGKSWEIIDPDSLRVKIDGKPVNKSLDEAKRDLLEWATSNYPTVFTNKTDIAKALQDLKLVYSIATDRDIRATLHEYASNLEK